MRTTAILPVKRFVDAKQRLGISGMAASPRADLARAMVGDVLVALRDTRSLDQTIVVTNEEPVAAAARYQGALVVADTAEAGQSAAVKLGVERALIEGFERVLCVPGDCPALDPAEIDALLTPPEIDARLTVAESDAPLRSTGTPGRAAHGGEELGVEPGGNPHEPDGNPHEPGGRPRREVVIVPDRHGTGTNGLLLTPPDVIAPGFGPGSCERHLARARGAGAQCRVARPGSLLLDVDTGADLAALRERLADAGGRAPRTRAVLGLATDSEDRLAPGRDLAPSHATAPSRDTTPLGARTCAG